MTIYMTIYIYTHTHIIRKEVYDDRLIYYHLMSDILYKAPSFPPHLPSKVPRHAAFAAWSFAPWPRPTPRPSHRNGCGAGCIWSPAVAWVRDLSARDGRKIVNHQPLPHMKSLSERWSNKQTNTWRAHEDLWWTFWSDSKVTGYQTWRYSVGDHWNTLGETLMQEGFFRSATRREFGTWDLWVWKTQQRSQKIAHASKYLRYGHILVLM